MIKELLNDDYNFNNYLVKDSDLPLDPFYKGFNSNVTPPPPAYSNSLLISNDCLKGERDFTSLDKIRIVVDGFIGERKIDEICKSEGITVEIYKKWQANFIKAFDYYSESYNTNKKIESTAKKIILEQSSLEVYRFFSKYVNFKSSKNFVVNVGERISSFSNFNNIRNVIFLDKMNDFRQINKHLEEINVQMPNNGLLFGNFETFMNVMNKSKINRIPVIGSINSAFVFLFKRVLPKIKYLNKIYFSITKGKNRMLSKAEALGRLVSCGFDIIDFKVIDGLHYFVAQKVKEPDYNMNPSYGPLFKMKRVGKNGKIIGVYKFRTMHPYSEYLQDYIIKLNGYSESGKPANDFRVVPWAKFLRKYWIDELPQLINVLKGEMKLVGVRPVSQSYFSQIPMEMQELRLTQKPGCIPPYVSLNRNSSVESVLEAEKDYLTEKLQKPNSTDIKYFLKAIYNILIKNKRSA